MKNNVKTTVLSLIVMALWGSLFPMVKVGYNAFNIVPDYIPGILMFAGLRFLICGFLVCIFCCIRKEKIEAPKAKSILNIVILGIFSIVLHYAFTYVGLGTTESSKTAIIKQSGALIYVCLLSLFFKDEKFSIVKIIGALVGFCGIIAINYSACRVAFSTGDWLILCASICTVIANIVGKKSTDGNSPLWITGISQLFGGIILFIISCMFGAEFLIFNTKSIWIFIYICAASIISYTLWYYILKNSSLSKMFIIKFAEPLFACVFGAILLGENIFRIQYLMAFILIFSGIIIGHRCE